MRVTVLLLLLPVLLLAGCGGDDSSRGISRVKADDKEMNGAIAHARETVGEFVTRLENPKPTDEGFSVKKMVVDGEKVEHFWLGDVSYSDGQFAGTIGNDPEFVRNVKFGQEVTVKSTEISDWMYLDNGKMVGNFTMRVLLKRIPKDQADALRKQYQIDE